MQRSLGEIEGTTPAFASEYALGELVPWHALQVHTIEALSEALRRAHEIDAATVFFGGKSLQQLGNLPRRYDLALDLRGMAQVRAYNHADLTISVEAGMTVAAFTQLLAKHGQFLPLDVPFPEQATIGGTLASGWPGPRRGRYGHLRDFVIGTSVVLADGTIANAGGMVVKNVSGYDMSKLYIGSLGTLAALAVVNFKTLTRPPVRRCARAGIPEEYLAHVVDNLRTFSCEPAMLMIVNGFRSETAATQEDDLHLIAVLEGSDPAVERATRELRSALGAAGIAETTLFDQEVEPIIARIAAAAVTGRDDRSITLRLHGSPESVYQRYEAVRMLSEIHAIAFDGMLDLQNGDIIARYGAATNKALQRELPELLSRLRNDHPSAIVLSAPPELRSELDMWGALPGGFATMQRLKEQFDPKTLLAPGRFVGNL